MEEETTTPTVTPTPAPVAPVTPAPVRPAPPPPPPLATSLSALQAIDEETLQLLSFIQTLRDENRPDATVAELFTDEDGNLNVYGELYPAAEGLADMRIDPDKFKGPISKVITTARQLNAAVTRLQQAKQQFEDRIARQTRTAARKNVGAAKLRHFRGDNAVKKLRPFDTSDGYSELTYATGGTYITTGSQLPMHVEDRSLDLKTRITDPESASYVIQNMLQEAALVYYNNLLDHSPAFRLAANLRKVTRNVRMHLRLDYQGHTYARDVTVTDGAFNFGTFEVTECSTASVLDEKLLINCALDYQMRFNKSELTYVVESLEDLEPLPIYRIDLSEMDDPFDLDEEDDDEPTLSVVAVGEEEDADESPELTAATETLITSPTAGEPAAGSAPPAPVEEEEAPRTPLVAW